MSDDKLRELGHELPWDRPDATRREAVRASLLLAADDLAPHKSRRGLAIAGTAFAAGVLAAAAVALLLVHPDRPTPGMQAQVTASPAAQLEHTIIGGDEVVRVHTGTVRVAAPKLATADHIRLETRDAAVEAVGAGDYEAVVTNDQLASVTVHTGTARVAVAGHEHPVFLSAGETWHAKVITADVTPSGDSPTTAVATTGSGAASGVAPATTADASATHDMSASDAVVATTHDESASHSAVAMTHDASATRAPAHDASPNRVATAHDASTSHAPTTSRDATSPIATAPGHDVATPATAPRAFVNTDRPPVAATTRTPSPVEKHFQAGWALLRANKPREAATELGTAADAGDRDPLAVDARYFQAVALTKAGMTHEAETALVAFLDRAPTSLRRGRASVMLARLIAERGDGKSARAWFESALHDPDPDVAAAAQAGLDGLRP